MKLSKRLHAVLRTVPPVDSIIDVGTDHGNLAVALLKEKKAQRVIASDVHLGPLQAAQNYIEQHGCGDVIQCRLGNGLSVLQANEVNAAIICGMGGLEIMKIILEAPYQLDFYVLQPQRNQVELRKFLLSHGYIIIYEGLVEERALLYEYLVALKQDLSFDKYEFPFEIDERSRSLYSLDDSSLLWEIGPLLHKEHELYAKHIQKLIKKRKKMLQGLSKQIMLDANVTKRLEEECIVLEGYL